MNQSRLPQIRTLDAPILAPRTGTPWADTMVLNPAIIDEPGSARLHMLFRASGPWPQVRTPGRPPPYPIFLGYAWSDDFGATWRADFSRPCLAPRLETDAEKIRIRNRAGEMVVNHANGCVEDPRLFRMEGRLYLSTACRMFAPGPYWERDDPMQCAPGWAAAAAHIFGRAARENLTISVLWEVDLTRLKAGDYERAFVYVAPLTDPERGDNRDAFLFSEKMVIDGRVRHVCLHRPAQPGAYGAEFAALQPAIFMAAAERLEDLGTPRAAHRLLAEPRFEWEGDRIGASWAPLPLGGGEWLLPYHGKQDAVVGYTQSFMILKPGGDGWPEVAHRCPDRLMFAQKRWELDGRFKTPCVFTCGGVVRDGALLMTYGAADTVAGAAWTDMAELVAHVRRYDAAGKAGGGG
ncbi:MAG: hypothetical protein LBI02_01570 [Opitutaceae bacterium]|nr:hypothetical protein [Opitutaceae bacterium]